MTDVQTELFELLKIFDGICKKHDIEYFLTGGSALGAIRHNGIIPWDDDIDMGMTRSMWNKLRPVVEENLPDGVELVCSDKYPTYHNPVVRIANTNSARITRAALADGCPKGQFLEIFIHDPVPKEKASEHKKLFATYCELNTPYLAMLQQRFRWLHGLKDDEVEIIDDYFRIKESCDASELRTLIADMERNLSKYDRNESDYYLLGWGAVGRCYPIEHFESIKHVRFEDIEVPVPVRACRNLRIDYRNEWKDYPEESEQAAHHMTAGVKGISGYEYMKLINEEIDPDETNAMRLAVKELNLVGLKDRVSMNKQMLGIRMRLAQDIDRRSADIAGLYKAGKYEEIIDRFSAYIDLKRKMLNYTITEDIRPETKELIASALVMTGRLTEAENVMDAERTLNPGPDNSDFVNDLLNLAISVPDYYDGFCSEAREELESVREEWHSSIAWRKMNAMLDMDEGNASKDAYKLFEDYPEDAETAKLAADAMMLDGRRSEAETIYRQVLENGKNGMDIQDIKKRLEV